MRADAINSLKNPSEKASSLGRNRMKMEAVPKRMPAEIP